MKIPELVQTNSGIVLCLFLFGYGYFDAVDLDGTLGAD